MARISEERIVHDNLKFDDLVIQYREMIQALQLKFPVTDGSKFATEVNFKNNRSVAKHNWFDYKHGYSEALVSSIIEHNSPNKNSYILDPYCGVGTTNLAAQSLGYKSIGFDINPVAILAASVKCAFYSVEDKTTITKLIDDFKPPRPFMLPIVGKVIISSFSNDDLNALLSIRAFVEEIDANEKVRNFFRLAYLSIIERCSTRSKDGNGLKLNPNKKPVGDIYQFYLDKCKFMFSELSDSNYDTQQNFHSSSLKRFADSTNKYDSKVALAIFSPPYANCFDYCEVYKLELWLGGYVESYKDFALYRDIAMRSHVNSKFDHTFSYLDDKVDLTANLISTMNIWNKNIPDMIRGYFDDTQQLLKSMHRMLEVGGKAYIVVANSGYKGVLVPTDLFIADIATNVGYKVNTIMYARRIRASSQQMHILHNDYERMMRETVIEIEKY
ncbi:DNA methylase [Pedobacter terrae]|uniref:DNA methylase n=1 Tax=Pedobacter terrae TaxID=405671 RepID=A0A1G8D880_9SPHI|nr:DNA methyltransferase [Pedobacter terrae]SDH53901.1 DNA methylase [Pedobacter terrae]